MIRSSQPSQSLQSQQEACLTEELVDAAVKTILVLDNVKKPIKHSDVLNNINVKIRRKQHIELWQLAKEKFKDIGMTLVDCVSTQYKSFLLVADSQDLPFMHMFASPEERADRTLIIIILSFIFMKEGIVTEDDLFRHLCSLQIVNEASWDHGYFGDVKKKLQVQYVEQLYITRTAVAENSFELKWGERAEYEVPKKSILEFVCKIGYNGRAEPKDFVSQFERVATQNEEMVNCMEKEQL